MNVSGVHNVIVCINKVQITVYWKQQNNQKHYKSKIQKTQCMRYLPFIADHIEVNTAGESKSKIKGNNITQVWKCFKVWEYTYMYSTTN